MWVHFLIFAMILAILAGMRLGWIRAENEGVKKGMHLFIAAAFAGNLLGMVLTAQSGSSRIYTEGYRLKKEADQTYEEKFQVYVDGESAGSLYVQIPQKEAEEEAEGEPDTELSQEEAQKKKLQEAVEEYNQEKEDPDYYYLPEKWEGSHLDWESPGSTSGTFVSFVFLAAGAALFVAKRREEQEALLKRREELLMDYPSVIMKFTLLVQAGMTARNIFRKMAVDYQKKKDAKKRSVYEEILITCHEMDSGISEMEAYRRFGERCGQVKYKTFSTLLIQNLQKGSRYLADTLEKESMEAWDERKRKARVLGEAAATKLLVPMVLMLLVVMAIIMIPTCLAFYGG